MPINKTIGVVEALNERISLGAGDLAKAQEALNHAQAKNLGIKAKRFAWLVLGVAGALSAALCIVVDLSYTDRGPLTIIGVFLAVGAFVAFIQRSGLVDGLVGQASLAAMRQGIEEKGSALVRLEQEKRNLLLNTEAEVKAEVAGSSSPPPAGAPDTKLCPMCAETIKAAAKVCRFCQHHFDEKATG